VGGLLKENEMKKTKKQRIMEILLNLNILRKDFENFRHWDTSDEDNWEAMIALTDIIEQQINNIA
jgi:hypothetical protein